MVAWYYIYLTFAGDVYVKCRLVGGFSPFEKYALQIGSFPQGSGVKIKNI